jgi:hypothetical protein
VLPLLRLQDRGLARRRVPLAPDDGRGGSQVGTEGGTKRPLLRGISHPSLAGCPYLESFGCVGEALGGALLATVRLEANAAYDNGGRVLPRPAARRQDVREARRSALAVRKKVPGEAREKAKILGR